MTVTGYQYLPSEPPALLTEAPTVLLQDHALELLNDYRQARHAYLSTTSATDPSERGRLREAHSQAAQALAGYVAMSVARQLGEPRDVAPVES